MSSEVEALIGKLRKPLLDEDLMKRWDRWRSEHASGYKGSGTRDEFESIVDGWDEDRADIADALARLSRTASVAVTEAMVDAFQAAYIGDGVYLKSLGYSEQERERIRADTRRGLEAAFGSAAAGTGAGEWRPHDQAPKDGTEFWAWIEDAPRKLRWWTDEECCIAEGDGEPEDYQEGFYDEEIELCGFKFWRPLDEIAAPPKSSGGQDA